MPFRCVANADALGLFGGRLPSTSRPSQGDAESTNLQKINTPSLFSSHMDFLPPLDPVAILEGSRQYFSAIPKSIPTNESTSTRPNGPASGTCSQTSGLSIFFKGMAAGEDMSTLIHILSQTLQRAGQTVSWPVSPLLSRAHTENSVNNDKNKTRASNSIPKVSSAGDLNLEDPFSSLSLLAPSASLQSSLVLQREWIKKASRAAALFSVESPAASDAVTLFYYSSCHTERLKLKGAMKGASDGRTESDIFFFRPHNEVLRPLLSDRVALALARQLLRDSHHKEDHSRHSEIERVLGQIDPTPAVSSVLIDLYSRTGQWEGALRSLRNIPRSLWTEFDITGVIRSFYRAALGKGDLLPSASLLDGCQASTPVRKHEREENPLNASKGDSGGKGPETDFFTYPLLLLKEAMEAQVSWSTPSAVNDALGLLSMRPSLWQRACSLLDATVLSPHPAVEPEAQATRNDGTVDMVACTCASSPEGDIGGTLESSAGAATDWGSNRDGGLRYMRPNVVTVYQTCRALSQAPEVAFSYAKTLLGRFDILLTTDFKAVEEYLSCCARAGHWEEALRVIKEHRLQLEKGQRRYTTVGQRGGGDASPADYTTSHTTRSGNNKPLNSNHQRMHYRPDVYLALVKLFGESRCSDGIDALFQQKSLSKFYNRQTLSRAFNALIQSSTSVDEAMRHYDELTRSVREKIRKRGIVKANAEGAEPRHPPALTEGLGASMKHGIFETLENESLHQLTLLNATEGHWEEAVTIFQHLLHDPRRKLYVPTTQVHDCVQYALAQAPASGASWQVSVSLFFKLCEERELPISPLAFNSTIKKCFSQGASEVAQTLFKFMIRKGVRH